MELMEKVKTLVANHPWVPWVAGGGLIAAYVLLRKRSAPAGALVPAGPAPTPKSSPGPVTSPPAPSVGSEGTNLSGLLTQLIAGQAQTIAAIQTGNATTVKAITDNMAAAIRKAPASTTTEGPHQTSASSVYLPDKTSERATAASAPAPPIETPVKPVPVTVKTSTGIAEVVATGPTQDAADLGADLIRRALESGVISGDQVARNAAATGKLVGNIRGV